MIRMLGVFALIVAVVVGLGFYLGWFHSSSASDGNSTHVTVSMDKGQIQRDKDKAVEKVEGLEQRAKDKIETATQKAQK